MPHLKSAGGVRKLSRRDLAVYAAIASGLPIPRVFIGEIGLTVACHQQHQRAAKAGAAKVYALNSLNDAQVPTRSVIGVTTFDLEVLRKYLLINLEKIFHCCL